MASNLIYKIVPTISIDNVESDLNNYEIIHQYTTMELITATVAGGETLNLPSPSSLPSTVPFIELITNNSDIDLTFKDSGGASITALTDLYYLSGNFRGYSFSITNNGIDDANITWRIYY